MPTDAGVAYSRSGEASILFYQGCIRVACDSYLVVGGRTTDLDVDSEDLGFVSLYAVEQLSADASAVIGIGTSCDRRES